MPSPGVQFRAVSDYDMRHQLNINWVLQPALRQERQVRFGRQWSGRTRSSAAGSVRVSTGRLPACDFVLRVRRVPTNWNYSSNAVLSVMQDSGIYKNAVAPPGAPAVRTLRGSRPQSPLLRLRLPGGRATATSSAATACSTSTSGWRNDSLCPGKDSPYRSVPRYIQPDQHPEFRSAGRHRRQSAQRRASASTRIC